MLIKITQDDIDTGQKNHCNNCPVALAVQRISVKHILCHVMLDRVYGMDSDTNTVWIRLLPSHVQLFIANFDDGKYVKPFEFDLEIPEKYLCDQAA